MSGAFSRWQPTYAAAGIATFPVDIDCKKPLVGNYLKAGLPASHEWSRKFPDANGIGFACGRKNRITVVDVDTTDEGVLAEALDYFGPTPVIIQTASGKYHCWYRHNGEGRHIRKAISGKPIDLLGGGYAIAPYSKGEKGEYRFLKGSLDDLDQLPIIAGRAITSVEPQPTQQCIDVGERNTHLFRALMKEASDFPSLDQLINRAAYLNRTIVTLPVPDAELRQLASNVWGYQERGENYCGSAGYIKLGREHMARAMAKGSDAYMLYCILRQHHWGRQNFRVANAMAAAMPDGKWTDKRLSKARSALVACGLLEIVRVHSKANGPAIYRFGQ